MIRMTPEQAAALAACRSEDERNALIVDVFRQLDETQSEYNARSSSYPPLWHGGNPLSPIVWIAGHFVVGMVWIVATVVLSDSMVTRAWSFMVFVLATIVFGLVYAAQRPLRWRRYGLNPDLRVARQAGWSQRRQP